MIDEAWGKDTARAIRNVLSNKDNLAELGINAAVGGALSPKAAVLIPTAVAASKVIAKRRELKNKELKNNMKEEADIVKPDFKKKKKPSGDQNDEGEVVNFGRKNFLKNLGVTTKRPSKLNEAVDLILHRRFEEANNLFEEIVKEILEAKLHEMKKQYSAKLSEVHGWINYKPFADELAADEEADNKRRDEIMKKHGGKPPPVTPYDPNAPGAKPHLVKWGMATTSGNQNTDIESLQLPGPYFQGPVKPNRLKESKEPIKPPSRITKLIRGLTLQGVPHENELPGNDPNKEEEEEPIGDRK